MTQNPYQLRPIGLIHSPHTELDGMPIQPAAAAAVRGQVVLDPEYAQGTQDLEGFSHLVLVYYFHRARPHRLLVKPFLDDQQRGLFATRAPNRPNPIGISVVRLLAVQGRTLEVEGLDVLDRTPLLDIKPYIPDFDHPGDARVGWLERKRDQIPGKLSDERFS